MKRGDLYRVRHPSGDPRPARVFVVVSRQALLDSKFSTAICAPIYTHGRELGTQVAVGPDEGLKHPSWIFCDDLASVRKSQLTDFVGTLSPAKLSALSRALRIALDIS
jgi:mRNA interferase MazF